MATMYPTQPSRNTKSRAELILFNKFQENLSNEYSVIHSKRWIDSDKRCERRIQGECDFIIVHPSKGILFIEAKSGKTFFCSAVENYWYDSDKHKEIKNPLNQVVESQFTIIKNLKRQLNDQFKLPYNYALAFPQAMKIHQNLPDELLPEMVILKPDLPKMQKKIDKGDEGVPQTSPGAHRQDNIQKNSGFAQI